MHVRFSLWPLVGLLVLAESAWVHAQPPPPKPPGGPSDHPAARTPGRSGPPVGPAEPRRPIEVPTGHPGSVYALTFSPDGNELATTCGRPDPRVRFWDPRTGRLIRTLEAHPGGARAVAYTPDGTRLLTSSGDREDVCVWDARTHQKLMGLKGHKHGAGLLVVSPDGRRLVSVGRYTAVDDVAVWDLQTGRRQHTHPTLAQSVQLAAFLPDGRTLVVTDTQRTRAWDVGARAGDGVRDLGDVPAPAGGAGRKAENRLFGTAAIAPGGRFVAVRGADRTDRLVEVLTGQEVWRIDRRVTAISPDGRTISCTRAGGDIELIDWPSETAVLTLRGHARPAYKVAFSTDGKRLASVGPFAERMTVLLWDLSDIAGRPLPKAEVGSKDLDQWCKDLAGTDARAAYRAVWRLAAAPDQAVPRLRALIRDRLRMTPADIDRWIADLDHGRFATREAATARLKEAGTVAVARMEGALKESQSAEQRRRLQTILAAIREAPVPGDHLFAARAGVVLEQIGTSEARTLLEEWTSSVPGAYQASQSRAVAERLAKQQTPRP